MMPPFVTERTSSWEYLKNSGLPIFIYGMGDGAVKILRVFEKYRIAAAGFFASDEFVRGHTFMGHFVHTLAQVEEYVDEFIVVLAFGAGYQSLYDKITGIGKRHVLLAPDVPVYGDTLFTPQYCEENCDKIMQAYELLADDTSRQTFADVINYKISGKPEYLTRCTSPREEVFTELLRLGENEIYIDMGAYNGDTVQEFTEITGGRYDKIFAMEPDAANFRRLARSTADLERVHLFNAAAWSEDTELSFAAKAGRQATLVPQTSTKMIKVAALRGDTLTENATYIKMDVEGAEHQALLGASASLKNGAKLAAAVYHRSEDIFDIPLLVHEINPGSKIFLRHHLYIPAWETNIYCTI